jgi:hypothetical protein
MGRNVIRRREEAGRYSLGFAMTICKPRSWESGSHAALDRYRTPMGIAMVSSKGPFGGAPHPRFTIGTLYLPFWRQCCQMHSAQQARSKPVELRPSCQVALPSGGGLGSPCRPTHRPIAAKTQGWRCRLPFAIRGGRMVSNTCPRSLQARTRAHHCLTVRVHGSMSYFVHLTISGVSQTASSGGSTRGTWLIGGAWSAKTS